MCAFRSSVCPSVRPSHSRETRYLRSTLREFFQVLRKRPLGPKDELIQSWSEVKGQSHCDLIKHVFGHNSRNKSLIKPKFHTNVLDDKIMK